MLALSRILPTAYEPPIFDTFMTTMWDFKPLLLSDDVKTLLCNDSANAFYDLVGIFLSEFDHLSKQDRLSRSHVRMTRSGQRIVKCSCDLSRDLLLVSLDENYPTLWSRKSFVCAPCNYIRPSPNGSWNRFPATRPNTWAASYTTVAPTSFAASEIWCTGCGKRKNVAPRTTTLGDFFLICRAATSPSIFSFSKSYGKPWNRRFGIMDGVDLSCRMTEKPPHLGSSSKTRSWPSVSASTGALQARPPEGACSSTYLAPNSCLASSIEIRSTASMYLLPMNTPSPCELTYL
jgi:hypothetical protein